MPLVVAGLLSVVFFGRRCDARIRINLGLGLYILSLLLMPLFEVFYIRVGSGCSTASMSPLEPSCCAVSLGLPGNCQRGIKNCRLWARRLCQASGYEASPEFEESRETEERTSVWIRYVTEDVGSEILKDWYPITLITGYYLFHLLGKSLASIYVIEFEDYCGIVLGEGCVLPSVCGVFAWSSIP
ncbi:unnamed protein product [Citrullus colocynthis]|uniref:Uncharacterized protein n=1 Tax=Citrullus colocynthis TaxID=252529 RepID=A0ABP0Y9D6_9ROSI